MINDQKDFYPDRATARELVGRGWWPLLDEAFDMAERQAVVIMQIKEKFGGLRVYLEPETPSSVLDFTDELERRSYQTCEACGAPGERRTEFGWHKTLCALCAARRRKGETWDAIMGFQPYTTPRD